MCLPKSVGEGFRCQLLSILNRVREGGGFRRLRPELCHLPVSFYPFLGPLGHFDLKRSIWSLLDVRLVASTTGGNGLYHGRHLPPLHHPSASLNTAPPEFRGVLDFGCQIREL